MDRSTWWTQQIAEFVVSISPSTTEAMAAHAAVERAAEVLDADVAAIMVGGELLAAVGYAEGTEPVDELKRVRAGAEDSWLQVPGVGRCPAVAASLSYPPGATLIVARQDGLTRQETAQVSGMARVAAMRMTMLSVLGHERAAREEVERLAREQAALRRVATLVARGALPDEVFAAVAQEVGNALTAADFAMVARYDPDHSVEVVGGWSRAGAVALVGRRSVLGGQNVSTLVFERNGPARVDDYLIEGTDAPTVGARELGMRSSAGAPISVQGRLWGVMIVASTRDSALLPGTECRLAEFTKLIATTIANTQARQEVSALADEQAALRRVATLVARGEPPHGVFAAVAQEVGLLLPADITLIGRYGDTSMTGLAAWSATGELVQPKPAISLGGRNVTEAVYRTGRPARLDSYSGASGDIASDARDMGISASVGAPISVEGRLWGIMVAASVHGQSLPPDTEARLAGFTELVATAIANAEAREELRRVADEQAALRRVATLVARGALPDEVFAAVAQEVGNALTAADFAMVARYDPDHSVEVVGGWSRVAGLVLVGRRSALGGQNVSTLVFERNRPARVDDHLVEGTDALTAAARETGMRSSAGAPISVQGRLWGVMIVASTRENALLPGTEHRLAEFTELIATTIANTQARQEVSALADEQAALRRVATLVARGEAPRGVFAAVAQEVGRLLPADLTLIGRYEDGVVTGLGGWSATGESVPTSARVSLGGRNVTEAVYRTGRPARLDNYSDASGDTAADARSRGISASVGVPISVEGRLWGIMVAAAIHGNPLPPDTEARLADFTELAATAIANAEAREELRRVADEQAALRRVATLVAHGAASAAVFEAVAEEVGRLLQADATVLARYDPGGQVCRVGAWSKTGDVPPAAPSRLGGRNVSTLVYQTARAARLDSYGDRPGPAAATWISAGTRSGVGAPISVDGRLWGLVIAMSMSDEPLPVDSEARLTGFTELVATAIANAQAHAELTASRARIVATADQTRRRIERDLHDGAQQRLVTLAMQLRAAQAEVPPQLGRLNAELDSVALGLSSTLDELREFARGIHPAILVKGGLTPALKSLARRSSIRVKLDIRIQERPPEHVEVAAYYVISEALVNAAKHAKASYVHVQVDATGGVLRLDVRDDGVGGADPARGSGLIGLRDRVEATGGTFKVISRRGEGTHLLIELPARPLQPASGS